MLNKSECFCTQLYVTALKLNFTTVLFAFPQHNTDLVQINSEINKAEGID